MYRDEKTFTFCKQIDGPFILLNDWSAGFSEPSVLHSKFALFLHFT